MPKQDLTTSTAKAQLYGVWAFLLGVPLLAGLFFVLWKPSWSKPDGSTLIALFIFIGVTFVSIAVHELVHALTAVWYGRIPWQTVKFGVDWKTMTPYFHNPLPMKARHYRVVVVMPLLVMGLLPYAIALLTDNLWLLVFGVFFTVAAAGDLMILWLMRHLSPDEQVQDHPTKVGLMVVSPMETAA